MKNKLLLSVTVVVLCILPVLSFGQTSTNAKAAKQETIKEVIDTKKNAVKNSVIQIKQDAVDKIKTVVDRFIQNIIDRFDAAINRLTKIADKMDSRIAKMETQNIDVAQAKELLTVARAKIETARASTLAIATNIESAAPATTASSTIPVLKENFKTIKTQIAKAKEDIKAAHAALVDVINILKPGANKLKASNN